MPDCSLTTCPSGFGYCSGSVRSPRRFARELAANRGIPGADHEFAAAVQRVTEQADGRPRRVVSSDRRPGRSSTRPATLTDELILAAAHEGEVSIRRCRALARRAGICTGGALDVSCPAMPGRVMALFRERQAFRVSRCGVARGHRRSLGWPTRGRHFPVRRGWRQAMSMQPVRGWRRNPAYRAAPRSSGPGPLASAPSEPRPVAGQLDRAAG